MDKRNYRRIGEFISPIDVRNGNGGVSRLVGLTIAKQFIPSVANTNGTDLTSYKIIRKSQFACSLMQVSRDGKMPVAMCPFDEPAIMSPAYPMFEVSKPDEILPEYLMMWFQRKEFDREACFYAVGGVRGSLEWEDFCNMRLPVPDIATQRRIVAEYQAVENRIATNEKLIAKLEDTAQTIYKKMFVDDIDPEHLPEGWKMGVLSDVASFKYGKLPDKHEKSSKYCYPVYSGYAITGYTDVCMFSDKIVVIIARGDSGTGKICLSPRDCFLSNLAIGIIPNKAALTYYLYYHLSNCDTYSLRSGSAQAQITINTLEPFKIIIPQEKIAAQFDSKIRTIASYIDGIKSENQILDGVLKVLLSKLSSQPV